MATEARIAELPAELRYIQYDSSLESQYLPAIRALISKDLSEPYSIYVYRYFLYQWGELCFMVCESKWLSEGLGSFLAGSPPRNFCSYRRRDQQTRNPPISLTWHFERLYSHAGCIFDISRSWNSNFSCLSCNRCHDSSGCG